MATFFTLFSLANLLGVATADDLSLLWTGATGGAIRANPGFEVVHHLAGPEQSPFSVQSRTAALVGKDQIWLATDGSLTTLLSALHAGEPQCAPPSPVQSRAFSTELLLPTTGDLPPVLRDKGEEQLGWQFASCTGGQHRFFRFHRGEPNLTRPAIADLELRTYLEIHQGELHFFAIPLPFDERSRVVHEIAERMGLNPALIYVDAGDFLDGPSSVRDGSLSLHRPGSITALAGLKPAALAPGRLELSAGLEPFLTEIAGRNLPYIATNLLAPAHLDHLPKSLIHEQEIAGRTVRIGFLGILDPAWADTNPLFAAAGVQIGDPFSHAQIEVERLHAAGVDVVIALTTANPALLAAFRTRVRGVDILLGDPSLATIRVTGTGQSLRELPPGARAAALTLPTDGLGEAHLWLGPTGTLSAIAWTNSHIPASAPPEPHVSARITAVRASQLPPYDTPLLPGRPNAPWEPAAWDTLLCEAVRQGSGADIAVLSTLPEPPRTPGPLATWQVADQLASLDTLEVHQIPGDRLQALADQLRSIDAESCGILPGQKVTIVGGRALDPDRWYRVVTSRTTLAETTLTATFAGLRSNRLADQPGHEALRNAHGQALTLRQAALDQLRTLAADHGADAVPTTLLAQAERRQPLLLIRARQLALTAERVEGIPDPAFSAMAETLAMSPSARSLGLSLDLALEGSGETIAWDLRERLAYDRLRLGLAQPEEIADDQILSSLLTIPGLATGQRGHFQLAPVVELLHDSELTPTEVATGPDNPRQSELSVAVGMGALPVGPLRVLRLAGFANQDLASPQRQPVDFGFRFNWELRKAFGPSLLWSTLGEFNYWAPTDQPDSSDLRSRAQGETRLSLPLSRILNVDLYAQGFMLQGVTPATRTPAFAWTVGSALNVMGALRLDR